MLDPDAVFANATALQRLNVRGGDVIELRGPSGWQRLRVAGTLAVAGPALLVLDIAAAQARLGMAGRLSRIDLRLMPGVQAEHWLRERQWPDDVRVAAADEAEQRRVESVARLSRQPQRAGAGGAAGRRLPRLLGARVVGGAAHADLRVARRARPDGARTPRLGARRGVVHRCRRQRARAAGRRRAGLARVACARWRLGRRLFPRHRARACRSVCGHRCCMAHWASPPPWAGPGGRRVRPSDWRRRRR